MICTSTRPPLPPPTGESAAESGTPTPPARRRPTPFTILTAAVCVAYGIAFAWWGIRLLLGTDSVTALVPLAVAVGLFYIAGYQFVGASDDGTVGGTETRTHAGNAPVPPADPFPGSMAAQSADLRDAGATLARVVWQDLVEPAVLWALDRVVAVYGRIRGAR